MMFRSPVQQISRFVPLLIVLILTTASVAAPSSQIPERPNFLIIAIDDLNDWVGCLDEHPQVKTPHIDRLARQGLLFTNAHVQATFCAPSRTSMLSGLRPTTTGCFEFQPRYDQAESLKNQPPWPLWLKRTGYKTLGGGKIFHRGTGAGWTAKSFGTILPSGRNPRPEESRNWPVKVWDWGPFPEKDSAMGDYRLALETQKQLRKDHEKPFLIVAGFRRPHVPLHVPQRWFDLYPEEQVSLPKAPRSDLDDLPHPEIGLEPHRAPLHSELLKKNLRKSLTQAYLASISFVDQCVGEVLQGLEQGPHHANTIVILWSDHGFHLGEKQHWAKRTLWEETTRIPLIISGPGIPANRKISQPAGLIDIYPTLVDLVPDKGPERLEGVSLIPFLRGQADATHRPVITSLTPDDHAVRSVRYRYIRYEDGSEELYDHQNDPDEFHNLADQNDLADIKQNLSRFLPE